MDARDNTDTNPMTSLGIPIYTLLDQIIANDNGDLWDYSIQNGINISPTGANLTSARPWTGTNRDGTSNVSNSLGSPQGGFQVVGEAGQTKAGWIHRDLANEAFLRPLFGISTPITAVPEPGSITLWTIGLVGLFGLRLMSKAEAVRHVIENG